MVKALLLALLAFAAPLQAQLVYACSAHEATQDMQGMAGDCCCCDEDGNLPAPACDTTAATADSPCMELTVTNHVDLSVRSPLTIDRDDHSKDLPPTTGPPLPCDIPAPFRPRADCSARAAVPLNGAETYLLTQRLRL